MFSLTIVFGPGPSVWTLLFKTQERAIEAQTALFDAKRDGNDFDVGDDFGQTCHLKSSETHGWMLEDMEQSKLAHIERALHQARVHAKGTELAQNDPVLRQAARQAQGGMPILSPGMAPAQNGRWPG